MVQFEVSIRRIPASKSDRLLLENKILEQYAAWILNNLFLHVEFVILESEQLASINCPKELEKFKPILFFS
jgi:hypothetical protein